MIQVKTDGADRLHAVWQASAMNGPGNGVFHTYSSDGGDNWSMPQQLAFWDPDDFVVGLPYLTARSPSELHLIYVDGEVIGSRGRYHRISRDGGETWSSPRHIITDMMGINGYVVPIVDGAGQIHLIINMRTFETQVTGIYYARWLGTDWSQVIPVDTSIRSAHYTAATVRLGNELHIVYTQLAGGEIWHMMGTISNVNQVPALPPLSTRSPVASDLPDPAPSQTTEAAQPALQATPTPMRLEALPGQSPNSAVHPLVLPAGATLLFIIGVLVVVRLRS
jgi:hypothetical protein